MIRRTRRGDIISTQHTRSTRTWFHLPPGTPLEKITVAMAPAISMEERQRLRLLRGKPSLTCGTWTARTTGSPTGSCWTSFSG